jgi:hypothetical protein
MVDNVWNTLESAYDELNDSISGTVSNLATEVSARQTGDNDLQAQLDGMQGQTRRFLLDFTAVFGKDAPTKADADGWLANEGVTPRVGVALKNSNASSGTYKHLFVYYTDPNDPAGLILSDDGIDTVSTASDASLGVVRGAGGVYVDADGDMHIADGAADDGAIGVRTLVDGSAITSLMGVSAARLTTWLQRIRSNLKALFAHAHTGGDGTAKIAYADLSGAPEVPSVGNGTVTIKQGGEVVGQFSVNQSDNTEIPLAAP